MGQIKRMYNMLSVKEKNKSGKGLVCSFLLLGIPLCGYTIIYISPVDGHALFPVWGYY